MAKAKPITWNVIQVKLKELKDLEKNPVKLSAHDAEQIQGSLNKFGQAIPLVANAPAGDGRRRMIDGHQRKTVELAAKVWGPETKVNVSVPDRLLTDDECDELSIRLRRNRGTTDMQKLVINFDTSKLLQFGFAEDELAGVDFKTPKLAEKVEKTRPKDSLRVLISVPVDQAIMAKEIIEQLEEIEGIEILYGGNNKKD